MVVLLSLINLVKRIKDKNIKNNYNNNNLSMDTQSKMMYDIKSRKCVKVYKYRAFVYIQNYVIINLK